MLTGQKLFSANEPGVAALAIVEGKVPKPSEKATGGSKVFNEIVLKRLSHDPKERYQTARDMALAIEKAIPPAPASQVGDWVRSIAFEVIDQRAAIIAKVEKTEVDTPAVLGGSGAAARGNEPTATFRIPTLNSASSGNADELARHLSPAPFRAHSPAALAVSSQSDESEVSSKTDASPARPAHTDVVVPPDTASTEELRSDEPTDVPDDVKSDIFPPIADDLESPSATASTKESVSSGEFRLPAPFPGASLGASASATFDTLGSSADTANDVPTLPIHQGHRWLKAGLGVVAVLGIAAIVVVMTRSAKQPQEHVVSQPSTVANTTTSPIDTTKNDAGRTGDASQGKDVGVDSSTPDAASISTKVDAGKSTTSGTAPKPARYVLPLPTRKNSWPPKKPSKQSSGNDFENLTRK